MRPVHLASTVCVGALLVGCSTPTVGSPRPISAIEGSERPREIRLDGKNPCSLIPESDFAKYHFENAGKVTESEAFKSPQCIYSTQVGYFAVTLVVTEGIEGWTDGGRNVDLAEAKPIEEFPAVTLISLANPYFCEVAVDVAEGQYLKASFGLTSSAASEVPEKCEYAHQLARSAMTGLVGS